MNVDVCECGCCVIINRYENLLPTSIYINCLLALFILFLATYPSPPPKYLPLDSILPNYLPTELPSYPKEESLLCCLITYLLAPVTTGGKTTDFIRNDPHEKEVKSESAVSR